jgi:hypothetical protein
MTRLQKGKEKKRKEKIKTKTVSDSLHSLVTSQEPTTKEV